MTSSMYIPLVKVADAANSASSEHSTFGRFMAKRTWFVMVKMCMAVRENWAQFARSSRKGHANFAQIRIPKGHNRHRRTAQYE